MSTSDPDATLLGPASATAEGSTGERAEPLGDPITLGRYVVAERIGQGGAGVVLLAYDPQLDRRVAIKVLHRAGPAAAERVREEARMLARLSEPHVVAVLDIGEQNGRRLVVMEHVEGMSLERWLAEQPRSWRRVIAIIDAIAGALAAAHRLGLVHRDVKPSNIVMDAGGVPRLLDFGVAAALPTDAPSSSNSLAGIDGSTSSSGARSGLVGTPGYAAPEQIDAAIVDARADQFGLCATLYRCLWGVMPFDGETPLERMAAAARGPRRPPRRADVPDALWPVIRRGLAPRPDDRHASVDELRAALARVVRRRSRGAIALGLAATTIIVLASAAVGSGGGRDVGCDEALDPPILVWDDARADALERGLEAAAPGVGTTIGTRLRPRVDTRVADLDEIATRTCLAAKRRTIDRREALARTRCLSLRSAELSALVAVLEAPTREEVGRALEAESALGDPRDCEHDALDSVDDEDEGAAWGKEIETRLVTAGVLENSGRIDEAAALASRVVAEAEHLGRARLIARAHHRLGSILERAGDVVASARELERAFADATASADDATASDAAIALVSVHGDRLGSVRMGKHWSRTSAALLVRRPDAARAARAAIAAAALAIVAGDLGVAQQRYAEALGLVASGGNAVDGIRHGALLGLANVEVSTGEIDRAIEHANESLELARDRWGEMSASAAPSLVALGVAYANQGRMPESRDALREAIAIISATAGEQHRDLMIPLSNLGLVLAQMDDLDGADAAFARAIAIGEHAILHPSDRVTVLVNRALLAMRRGDAELARREAEAALVVADAELGPRHPDRAFAVFAVARIAVARGDAAVAVELLEPLAATFERSGDATQAAEAWFVIGQARRAVGATKRAIAALEHAKIVAATSGAPEGMQAEIARELGEIEAEIAAR